MSDNSKKALIEWVNEVLKSAKKHVDIEMLKRIAFDAIEEGYWRGDISDMWRKRGVTIRDLPRLYV